MKKQNIKKAVSILALLFLTITFLTPAFVADIEDYEDDTVNNDPDEDWYTYSKYQSGTAPDEFNVATLGGQQTFAINTTADDGTKVRNDYNLSEGGAYTYWEFDAYINSSGHQMGHILCGNGSIFSSGTSSIQGNRIVYMRFGDGTDPVVECSDDDNSWDTQSFSYPEDEWFHVRINMNYTDETYQVVLNTTFEGNWVTFGCKTESDHTQMNNISFGDIDTNYFADIHYDNLTVHGLSDEGEEEGTWSNWSDYWTISTSHSGSSTGYEYGNWTHSEHINSSSDLEEAWAEANNTFWYPADDSTWWMGNFTYEVNTTLQNCSFSVLNNSGMNRSQLFGWVHSNDTEVDAVFPFVIFAYNTSQDFDCVMWSSLEAWIFHWNGTNMTDMTTGDAIVDPSSDGTDLSDQWLQEGVYLTDEGNYFKLLYNEHNGSIKFKWWGNGFMSEPTGWTMQTEHTNITYTDHRSVGIGVWNPDARDTFLQWDLFNVWQLNYSVNTSDYCNISGYNESRPHMEFPVINVSDWTEEFMTYFNDSYDGNFSINLARTIMKDNITNPMNLESRMFELKSRDSGQQNDTVYYYSCMIDNFTQFAPESYDEWLHLHVQMCPEDDIEDDEYGDFMVGIDVDNDRAWTVNDRFYWGYVDDAGIVTFQTYNGNGEPKANIAACNIWESDSAAMGNLHRYGTHLNYAISIPLADLVKSDGFSLNKSDTFGLHISTTTSGMVFTTQDPCVWQNWNETSESTYIDEEDNMANIVEYFLNCSGEIEGYVANTTNLQRWGEGQIVGDFTGSGETESNVTIEKYANITSVASGSTYALINYTVYVNNTGSGTLTGVVVNDTKFNCSCHDFNETEFNTNVPWANVTNLSCYRLFSNASIAGGTSWEFWYTINVSNCSGITSGTLRNNISVNASQLDNAVETYETVLWGEYAERVCVVYTTDATDVGNIGESVLGIIGLVLLISAILAILYVVQRYNIL